MTQHFRPRVSVTAPLDWLVRGLAQAVDRFRENASRSLSSGEDVAIPLFEALHWSQALREQLGKSGQASDPSLDALRFVRNRTHHHAAAAMYPDSANACWCWYPSGTLPPGDPKRADPKGERLYDRDLAN